VHGPTSRLYALGEERDGPKVRARSKGPVLVSMCLFIYLFILSYGMEPMGYGLKMRKKARKEKQ
jgi:hypothetical protein